MCLVVVSAVGDLPGDVPSYLGGLLEAAVDWSTEIRCPEASLRGCVSDYRDTVAYDSGSECGAVRVPVLSGERAEELQRHATRVCLSQSGVVVSRKCHDCPGNAYGRSNAVYLPD